MVDDALVQMTWPHSVLMRECWVSSLTVQLMLCWFDLPRSSAGTACTNSKQVVCGRSRASALL